MHCTQLSVQEMTHITGEGDCKRKGDYLAWSHMNWTLLGNISMEEVGETDMCRDDHKFVFTEDFHWESCIYLCPKIQNGRVPSFENTTIAFKMFNWLKTVSSAVETWSPYTDKDKEGTFVDFYTGKAMQDVLFQANQPNGGTSENCGWYDKEGKIWDQPCKEEKFMRHCVCRFQKQPIIRLRGLCADSFLDTKYTLHQGSLLGFYGLSTTKIWYDKDEGEWQNKSWTLHATRSSH